MGRNALKDVKGLLLDLDGVLYVGDRLLDGATLAIEHLRSRQIPVRFTTNTTTRSLSSLHSKLARLGLSVELEEVFGVIQAAVAFLRQHGRPGCKFLLTEDPLRDFVEFPTSDTNPDFIVVGDVGKRWDYSLMNQVCRLVLKGSELVALHKGKYWETENGLQVDMGAFIAGIEYVTDRTATVVGKPSESFFRLAAGSLGLRLHEVAMIGDDIDSDVGGAQRAGMKGVLVKTGKYRENLVARSMVKPDLVIDCVGDLIDII